MTLTELDALIMGAGFSGIYQLYKLRNAGLKCLCIDIAGDVGGTWYWNLYPGAMSDTESFVYRYTWDKEDLLTYPWQNHYLQQPEVLAYLRHVVERHDLREDMQFNTQLLSQMWDESGKKWHVELSGNRKLAARYIISGLGLLSRVNFPHIPGIESYQGEKYHTARWPEGVSVEGKRIGVIGCGSTGIQVITEVARKVKTLVSFQRHPQYSVPSGDKKMTQKERDWINRNWDKILQEARESKTAFGIEEATKSWDDFTPKEREEIFENLWQKGNGFRFMFGGFNDVTISKEANEGACEFIRKKIDQIVKDPEKARKLKPHDVYARRPLCDGNASNGQSYYEQFNRENVDVVSLEETPITSFEEKGIRTADGKFYELDMVVFATGFDAVEGNYTRIDIRGKGGRTLTEAWEELGGATSYLGVAMPGFPNFFMITGPKGPFTNIVPAIERQVEFVTALIEAIEGGKGEDLPVIEAKAEAERNYSALCDELAASSLFWSAADNWIFGANVPGKKRCLRFNFGGMKSYLSMLSEEVERGYPGFEISRQRN